MPRKPTTPFGYIAFGKDGTVSPHIEQLSSTKSEQELRVGTSFVRHALNLCGETASVRLLEENNHDFAILLGDAPLAYVQCTEIVYRDFLAPTGTAASESILIEGQLCPVDITKRDETLRVKIENKLKKHYSKPEGVELWLLIWSVTGYLAFYQASSSGKLIVPESVQRARDFLQESSAEPFDKILSFNMLTRPTVIWPI